MLQCPARVPWLRSGGALAGREHASPSPSSRAQCRPRVSAAPRDRSQLSPGAGLPTAEEQADAAFDDLLLTSLVAGPQSEATAKTTLEKAREQAQAQSEDWTAAKSRGAFWELQQLFGALSGGAHKT